MTPEVVMDLLGTAFYLTVVMVALIVGPSLAVGLLVSMFQAATQINEQTMSFLPRLLVTLFVLSLMAPWLAETVGEFTRRLISDIPFMIG